ncbi:hypothetical protein ACFWJY_39145 [Streptomyces anulatus]|uniref:hypothetical protein n=1 Tax=Streptomyces anulatus TaxID=1892 RepID=UPI003665D63A
MENRRDRDNLGIRHHVPDEHWYLTLGKIGTDTAKTRRPEHLVPPVCIPPGGNDRLGHGNSVLARASTAQQRQKALVRMDHLRYPGEADLAFDQRDSVQRQ